MNHHYNAHAGQIADQDNMLRFDNIVIEGKISKNKRYFVAVSAMEFEYDDDEGENDTPRKVSEVIDDWARPVVRSGSARIVDGMVAVYCSDKVFRPIVWKDENGKGKCLLIGEK